MYLYKPQKRLISDLVRDMVKKKRKPRVFNWVIRGCKDAIANTPYKHAPTKNVAQIPRDKWSPEVEQYMDGLLSTQKDMQEGLIDDSQSISASPKQTS